MHCEWVWVNFPSVLFSRSNSYAITCEYLPPGWRQIPSLCSRWGNVNSQNTKQDLDVSLVDKYFFSCLYSSSRVFAVNTECCVYNEHSHSRSRQLWFCFIKSCNQHQPVGKLTFTYTWSIWTNVVLSWLWLHVYFRTSFCAIHANVVDCMFRQKFKEKCRGLTTLGLAWTV